MRFKFDVQKLVRERVRQRISVRRLAQLADLSVDTVYRIERGARGGTQKTIFAMSEALGVPMDELIIDENRTKSDQEDDSSSNAGVAEKTLAT
jgi:transcriptional regulator with XRE-family HTH domain